MIGDFVKNNITTFITMNFLTEERSEIEIAITSLKMYRIRKEDLMNVILVNDNKRNAMLFQPVNYKETSVTDPITLKLLQSIHTLFPKLLFTIRYYGYQGIIISKKDYSDEHIDSERMGKILDYPCYEGFDELSDDSEKTVVNVYVHYKTLSGSENKTQLFANVANEVTDEQKAEFDAFIPAFMETLIKDDYMTLLNKVCNIQNIEKIQIDYQMIITIQSIIDGLIAGKEPSEIEKEEIHNILYNTVLSENFQLYFIYNFEYDNPIHIGILLQILMWENKNPLSVFYPLYRYPQQSEMVDAVASELEQSMIQTLQLTKKRGSTGNEQREL